MADNARPRKGHRTTSESGKRPGGAARGGNTHEGAGRKGNNRGDAGFRGNNRNKTERRENPSGRNGSAGKKRKSLLRKAPEAAPKSDASKPKVSPARTAALEVITLMDERDAFAQNLISKYVDSSSMSREDRAFATRLILGVVSTRGTLDEVIDKVLSSPSDIKENVRRALRISVYEILYLDKADHAAVDQGVELVRSVAPRASRVANYVLHQVLDEKNRFPFGNPRTDLDAYARLHAFPRWLVEKLIIELGGQGAHEFMVASNEPAPLYVAVNRAKATDAEVFQLLRTAHGEPEQVEIDGYGVRGCYRITSGRVLADVVVKRHLDAGEMIVSDASSQAIAQLILPDALPLSCLEICAGRGTKTLLIQSSALRKYGTQIPRYVTVDLHEFKTRLLSERADQAHINVSEAITADAAHLDAELNDEQFDLVFIDAPCTGIGTLRRHPEIRWRLTPESIEEHAQLDQQLIEEASRFVKPGGTLAYATCTVMTEENSLVVKNFLKSECGRQFRLLPINGHASFSPKLHSGSPDAHFAVKMQYNGQLAFTKP